MVNKLPCFALGLGCMSVQVLRFLVSVNKWCEVLLDKCCFIKVKSSSLSCLLKFQRLVTTNPLAVVVLEKNYH